MFKNFVFIVVTLIVSSATFAQTPTPAYAIKLSTYSPGTPANGLFWFDGTHVYARISGVSYQLDQQTFSGLSGTTGSTNNVILVSDGTGGLTVKPNGGGITMSGTVMGGALSGIQSASSMYISATTGLRVGVGSGTTAAAQLHSEVENNGGSSITRSLRLAKSTTTTPNVGIGTGLEFDVETSASNFEIGAAIEAVTTDVTSTSEDFDLRFLVMSAGATASEVMRLKGTGNMVVPTTVTTGGTTGNQTINKISGTVNFAAAATSLTVTNSLVTTNSIVFAVVRTNDSTAEIKNVVPSNGSFVINLSAAATAETSVGFFVIN